MTAPTLPIPPPPVGSEAVAPRIQGPWQAPHLGVMYLRAPVDFRRIPAMCRNITILRGLEPPATPEEIEAAALQFVRKVSGVQKPSSVTEGAIQEAVSQIALSTGQLLASLPPRKVPPRYDPPLRRKARSAS